MFVFFFVYNIFRKFYCGKGSEEDLLRVKKKDPLKVNEHAESFEKSRGLNVYRKVWLSLSLEVSFEKWPNF